MGQRCCSSINASEVAYVAGRQALNSFELGRASGTQGRPKRLDAAAEARERTVLSLVSTSSNIEAAEEFRRSASLHTNAILVEGDQTKTLDELLRDLEFAVALLQTQYQNVLRHPDARADALLKANALMKRFGQQVRRVQLRMAASWQGDGDGDAEEWLTLINGGRRRFNSLQDVVKQVQLEGRIIRRWRQRNIGPLPDVDARVPGDVPRVDIDSWEAVDVFKLEQKCQQPLTQVFMSIWDSRGLAALSRATTDQALELVRAVEAAYRQNPYHNRMHAAEVSHCAYYLWTQLAAQEHMRGYFTELDLLAVVLAAAVHDMAHPGTGNDFLVKTQHALALRYSDRSVLEHFHAASAFALMKEMNVPLLEHSMPSPPAETLKGRVVDMVLATDMARHRRTVEDMAAELATHEPQDVDKLVLEQHLLHLADIGHPLRPRTLHREWSGLVREEFFAQGDQERRLGLQPTPLCDREKAPTLAKSQQGFLSFVILPAWRPMCAALGAAAKPLERLLADNQAMWEELAAEERAKEEAAKEAAASEEEAMAIQASGGSGGVAGGRGPASPCRAAARGRKMTTSIF